MSFLAEWSPAFAQLLSQTDGWLLLGVFVVAVMYSSVGHAGASGYIAVMSLLGFAPAVIKPTGLALNILVASLASWHFVRAGHFSWRLFWPYAVLAVPCAFLGGYLHLSVPMFNLMLGVVLLLSALHFVRSVQVERSVSQPALPVALGLGAAIGLLSGLTGTGGGIFLTPLMLMLGWAGAKRAAAVSAVFILVNSVAGLLGNWSSTTLWPAHMGWLMAAVVVGGSLGAYGGSRRFAPLTIRRVLALVLVVAGLKLILT
jgi:uncharacterized protein